jgi:hypothetical protein
MTRLFPAALCGALGAFLVAIWLGFVKIVPARDVPYWIFGLAGALFLIAALGIALPQRATRLQAVLAATMYTGFAYMGLWIGFGPGERHFSGSASIGPVTFGNVGSTTLGRVMFGAGGLLAALVALLAWRRALRPRDPSIDAPSRIP